MFKLKKLAILFVLGISASCVPGGGAGKGALLFNEMKETQRGPTGDSFGRSSGYKTSEVIRPKVMDRFAIGNEFLRIWGDSPAVQNQKRAMLKMSNIYGGSCDPYEAAFTEDQTLEFPDLFCYQGSDSWSFDMNSGVNPLREGYRIRACDSLAAGGAINDTFTGFGIDSRQPLNQDGIAKLFKHFFPTTAMPSNLPDLIKTELEKLPPETGFNVPTQNIYRWRDVVMLLCIDPHWQVI